MTRPGSRVRRNDWGSLEVPALGRLDAHPSVSVVVPTYRAERTLPFVLAGLAAQTYPAHLLEVIVVDDSPAPLAALPEVRPENTRVVRTPQGWGRAAACHSGALAAEGEVLHWLDSDMLVEPTTSPRSCGGTTSSTTPWCSATSCSSTPPRWTGSSRRRSATPWRRVGSGTSSPARSARATRGSRSSTPAPTYLRESGPRAHRAHVGATASLHRALYLEAGGMDLDLKLGEDSALGYRLAECGAVFVPDREARSWHLGPTHVMRRQDEVNDYNFPFLADRIPDGRVKRATVGRQYAVPYVEVVLDSAGESHRDVVAVVDAVLASTVPDLVVTLLGPWSALSDERVAVLDDPHLDARLVHAAYVSEPRVRLREALDPGRGPAMLRLTLSSAAWAPDRQTVNRMVRELEWTHHGLRTALQPDGATARLERTAAVQRARRVLTPGEDLDDVVDELFGSWWVDGPEVGFAPAQDVVVPRLPGRSGPARDPATLPETEGGPGPRPRSPPPPGQPAPRPAVRRLLAAARDRLRAGRGDV